MNALANLRKMCVLLSPAFAIHLHSIPESTDGVLFPIPGSPTAVSRQLARDCISWHHMASKHSPDILERFLRKLGTRCERPFNMIIDTWLDRGNTISTYYVDAKAKHYSHKSRAHSIRSRNILKGLDYCLKSKPSSPFPWPCTGRNRS